MSKSSRYLDALQVMLAPAKVVLDGPNPWDIRVHDPKFAQRILAHGTMGVGESYMDGQWDSGCLDEMLFRVFRAYADEHLPGAREVFAAIMARVRNPQTARRSFKVGRRHYDIGDDLYERMLDRRMIYSCGYWRDAGDLEAAQVAKLDLICRKLRLKPGMRVLDIGCGWGGAAQFAAERYGVSVVGVTVSQHQADAARERCKHLPVEILLQDYRSLRGRFDRIFSIGMFEHVGFRNYRRYFRKVRQLLADDGLFLLHTIGANVSQKANDPWIERHIFPNSLIPSLAQIAKAMEKRFVIEDVHGFGPDYDRTLMEWYRRIQSRWGEIAQRYDERFRRMWTFWLLSSAAHFRARRGQLWQLLLSPSGIVGGCEPVR